MSKSRTAAARRRRRRDPLRGGTASSGRLRARSAVILGLLLAVGLIYSGSLRHEFVYDDFQYLVNNPAAQRGFSAETIYWALTARYASNWHPVTWLSHILDLQLFGLSPAGHHLVNLLFHAANAVLLFLVLGRLTGALWRSALVAALFAVHPLHVESVAWVSERKDLLSTFFLLLTLEAHRRYVDRPRASGLLFVAVPFALGLMAKPMLVTLPVLLLLLDFWPLERPARGVPVSRLILEKVPLALLSAVSALLTVLAQREGGSMRSVHQYAFAVRVENALVSGVAYLVKMLLPYGLSAFYPHPGPELSPWKPLGSALILAVISAAAIRQRRSRPWFLAGWLWYLVALTPVIGLVQVGDQAMADRYSYLPLVGIFIVLAWGAADLVAGRPRLKRPLAALAGIVLLVLAAAARVQVSHWENGESLFRRALSVTKDNWFAHISLAASLGMQGDLEGAVTQYREALSIRPRDAILHNNLGFILGRQGRIPEALDRFREAAALKADYPEPIFNAGVLHLKMNDFDAAGRQSELLDRVDRRWAEQLREFIRIKRGSP